MQALVVLAASWAALAGADVKQRVAVFDTAAAARPLSSNMRELLSERPEFEVVSSDHLIAWFGPCNLEPSEHCLRSASKAHKVDLVLRVWASEGAGKLSVTVDRFEPRNGFVSTFEGGGVALTDRAAIKRLAELAVAKVIDGRDPAATAAPTATPEPLKPLPADVPAATKPPTAPPLTPAPVVTTESAGPSSLRVASYVAASVGIAALVVGGLEAATVHSKNNAVSSDYAAARAGDPSAQARVRSNLDAARSAATVSNVALAGGAAAVAGGVILFLVSPSSDHPTASAALIDGKPGVFVAGTF